MKLITPKTEDIEYYKLWNAKTPKELANCKCEQSFKKTQIQCKKITPVQQNFFWYSSKRGNFCFILVLDKLFGCVLLSREPKKIE